MSMLSKVLLTIGTIGLIINLIGICVSYHPFFIFGACYCFILGLVHVKLNDVIEYFPLSKIIQIEDMGNIENNNRYEYYNDTNTEDD